MEYVIQTDSISHSFGEKQVLREITLQIGQGEIIGLLGPSGAGKTTLIKILTGQLEPTAGTAILFGKESKYLRGEDYSQIGMMMDHFGLYERLNCYDNLKFFAEIYGLPKDRIETALKKVGLSEAKKTVVMNLSKGMRSRMLLARVLMNEPQILFLDEPTSGLDPATAEEIHNLILAEKKKGVTVFLTTHNMVEAEKLCDRIALLHEGRIVEQGKPKEICRKYHTQKTYRIHLQDGSDLELPQDQKGTEMLMRYLEQGSIETIHSMEPDLETVFMELTGRRFE